LAEAGRYWGWPALTNSCLRRIHPRCSRAGHSAAAQKTPWTTNNEHNILGNHTNGGTNGLGTCTPWTGGGACSTAGGRSEDTTGGSAGGLSSSPMPWRNETVVLTGTTSTPAYADNNTSQNSSRQQQTRGETSMNLNTKAKITVATLNMNGRQEAGMGPLSKWGRYNQNGN
jgi:hypothetical protein